MSKKLIEAARSLQELVDIKEPVAILDEHFLEDDDGNKIVYLSPALLQRFADNGNRRIKTTGDWTPIVVGHTKDGQPETAQPEVIGFAGEFFVGPLFKTGKKALWCRKWRIYKDKLPLLRKFPRRSVEIWLKRMEIDPISLLGATTPDRDLGPVRLEEKGESFTSTIEDPMEPNGNVGEIVQQVLAQLQQTDMFKKLEQLVSLLDEEQSAPTEAAPPEGQPPATPPEGQAPVSETPPPEEPVKTEEEPEEPVQKAASASGSNTMIPGDKAIKYSREEVEKLRADLDAYKATAEAQGKALNGLVKKSRQENRKSELLRLQNETGINLDLDEEVEDAETLDEAGWQKRLGLIKKRYARPPLHQGRIIPTDHSSASEVMGSTPELVSRAIEISTRTGREYEDVLASLQKGN